MVIIFPRDGFPNVNNLPLYPNIMKWMTKLHISLTMQGGKPHFRNCGNDCIDECALDQYQMASMKMTTEIAPLLVHIYLFFTQMSSFY